MFMAFSSVLLKDLQSRYTGWRRTIPLKSSWSFS